MNIQDKIEAAYDSSHEDIALTMGEANSQRKEFFSKLYIIMEVQR